MVIMSENLILPFCDCNLSISVFCQQINYASLWLIQHYPFRLLKTRTKPEGISNKSYSKLL